MAGRESLARCTCCDWAGVYPVQPVLVSAYAAGAPAGAALNPCPRCRGGEARCAVNVDEEREAIRQQLAAARLDVQTLQTTDGKLAIVVRDGHGVPRVITFDPAAIAHDPRAALEQVTRSIANQGGSGEPGPYR